MKQKLPKSFACAVGIVELMSMGAVTPSAYAQDSARMRRDIKRNQQKILHQQQEIEANQRRIQAQQEQIAQQGAKPSPPTEKMSRGLLGNIGNCPVGYSFDLFQGCLPAVIVVH